MLLESFFKTLHSLHFLQGSHAVSNQAPKPFKFQKKQPSTVFITIIPGPPLTKQTNLTLKNKRQPVTFD
ncbi:rCG39688 [Rattus norvegicus]|uniref:RCG39688 n=1 Tax=Rattus norvegicus TaxID=10116 RepID=A6I8D0_RAT|nr:rCG39688 [Rattus norvegicus]